MKHDGLLLHGKDLLWLMSHQVPHQNQQANECLIDLRLISGLSGLVDIQLVQRSFDQFNRIEHLFENQRRSYFQFVVVVYHVT